MKEFFKKNSDLIIKMIVHQIGLTVFGFLLYSCANVSGNQTLVIGFSVFSAAFYLFLIYILFWEKGAKDKVRIDSGRLEMDKFKGVKVCLASNIHNILLATLSLIGYLCIDRTVTLDGKFTSPEWAANLYLISHIIGVYLNSMYTGIGDYFNITVNPAFLFIIIIPGIIVCGLGYYLGTKEKFGFLTGSK